VNLQDAGETWKVRHDEARVKENPVGAIVNYSSASSPKKRSSSSAKFYVFAGYVSKLMEH
jgi:hypothetical protein